MKKTTAFATAAKEKPATLLKRLEYFSDWFRAKRALALCKRYVQKLKERVCRNKKTQEPTNKGVRHEPVTVDELEEAEKIIIKLVQREAFADETRQLKKRSTKEAEQPESTESRQRVRAAKKKSPVYRLDPFIDEHEILRIGGRIRQASISSAVKHPVLLPKKGRISWLVVKDHHERTRHQGRGFTLNEIRSCGYWIIGGSSVVTKLIGSCATCKKLRAAFQGQKMADLPEDRLEPTPPFTYCGADYFGPWYVKEGRKELKRYGVLFTCLFSRAVHLEVAHTLETDSYINALRRFICRRGPVRRIRSDQGTNCVGAKG